MYNKEKINMLKKQYPKGTKYALTAWTMTLTLFHQEQKVRWNGLTISALYTVNLMMEDILE